MKYFIFIVLFVSSVVLGQQKKDSSLVFDADLPIEKLLIGELKPHAWLEILNDPDIESAMKIFDYDAETKQIMRESAYEKRNMDLLFRFIEDIYARDSLWVEKFFSSAKVTYHFANGKIVGYKKQEIE